MPTLELKLTLKFKENQVNIPETIADVRQVLAELYRERGDVEVILDVYEDMIE